MRIVYIHSAYCPGDLIGSWFSAVQKKCRESSGDAWIAIKYTHRDTQINDIVVGNSISCGIHNRIFEYSGLQDAFSYISTKKFLKKLDKIRPDIIHCHVANDFFLHLGLLCEYVNKRGIKVVWTFHDARVMTGQCAYPGYIGCSQWKTQCHHCLSAERIVKPSREWANFVGFVHKYRKRTIGNIDNLMIVTPSSWMASLVAQSYLKDKTCVVIPNGIDLNVFKPIINTIRNKYGISNSAKLLLAVGNPLGELKGRTFLHRFAKELPLGYTLVMIGCLPEDVEHFKSDQHVIAMQRLPREELVGFYSAADLLVNPTLADNFPTVNLEAQACGCPVVAFDSDGTPETIAPKGRVVPRQDYDAWKSAIIEFEYEGAKEDAIAFAQQFSKENCMEQYVALYKDLLRNE